MCAWSLPHRVSHRAGRSASYTYPPPVSSTLPLRPPRLNCLTGFFARSSAPRPLSPPLQARLEARCPPSRLFCLRHRHLRAASPAPLSPSRLPPPMHRRPLPPPVPLQLSRASSTPLTSTVIRLPNTYRLSAAASVREACTGRQRRPALQSYRRNTSSLRSCARPSVSPYRSPTGRRRRRYSRDISYTRTAKRSSLPLSVSGSRVSSRSDRRRSVSSTLRLLKRCCSRHAPASPLLTCLMRQAVRQCLMRPRWLTAPHRCRRSRQTRAPPLNDGAVTTIEGKLCFAPTCRAPP
mmetsp:Transcript_677/g.2337  ORF Transcript_677/g.2337 Transcript_677/m.2337 type:complete len:293 (-) Transcript_677:587-1465(-)